MIPEIDKTAQKHLALMKVSSVIGSHHDLGELFDALADCLQQLLGLHYLNLHANLARNRIEKNRNGRAGKCE